MDLSIIIINWNTKSMLFDCLTSIFNSNPTVTCEVIVVDNFSTDGSVEMVKSKFPSIVLIENSENLGFCKAANKGIRKSVSENLLILNSDTKIFTGTLDTLIEFAKNHSNIGAVGPMLINSDGSLQYSCRRFPSFIMGTIHAFLGFISPSNSYTKSYMMTDWDHKTEREVDWISGAAMFLRKEAVLDIGLFDENYFMYVEDVDICYQLWKKGWKVYYCPQAKVMHYIGESSKQKSPGMIIEHHRSMYYFLTKQNKDNHKRIFNFFIAIGLSIRAVIMLVLNFFKKKGS
ncbi:MAG: glycosyltransferase family 2 protein [Actinobacteria bacterium]|nr:glycosyltransferase family 2 protein [Actinomycetota bacterium]